MKENITRPYCIALLVIFSLIYSCGSDEKSTLDEYTRDIKKISVRDIPPTEIEIKQRFKGGAIREAVLRREIKVNGWSLPKWAILEFAPDGSPATFHSSGNIKIQGIYCWGGSIDPIIFYSNGQLKSCMLGNSAEIFGHEVGEKSTVSFYDNGVPITLLFFRDYKMYEIEYNRDGSIKSEHIR